jgi:hypothetical protein
VTGQRAAALKKCKKKAKKKHWTKKKLKKCKKKAKLLPVTLLLGDEMRQG